MCTYTSGKHTKNDGKIHHFQWVNPLFRLGHFNTIGIHHFIWENSNLRSPVEMYWEDPLKDWLPSGKLTVCY